MLDFMIMSGIISSDKKPCSFPFLSPQPGELVSAPNESDCTIPEAKRSLACLQCEASAAKIAQQAELIRQLQSQVASQQQELSSRDAMSWLRT